MTDLTLYQKRRVREFMKNHRAGIGRYVLDLGCTETQTHKINFLGVKPVKQQYRRFLVLLHNELSVKIDKLFDQGIIEPSSSAWGTPLVPV